MKFNLKALMHFFAIQNLYSVYVLSLCLIKSNTLIAIIYSARINMIDT